MKKKMLFLLCFFLIFLGKIHSNPIFFHLKKGELEKGLSLYLEEVKKTGSHDYELLHKIGLLFLEHGALSRDPETILMTIFGAGIATSEEVVWILEQGLKSPNRQIQVTSLNLLHKYPKERMIKEIKTLLGANDLILRLEAIYYLALDKNPMALEQIEALMNKIPAPILAIFPKIFAMMGDFESIRYLKKFMHHSLEVVRLMTIQAVMDYERDDLLPIIQSLSLHPSHPQQEMTAVAMGRFPDERSIPYLERLTKIKNSNIQLAAHQSLYQLGKKENRFFIEKAAKQGNLFAILSLQEMENTEELLYEIVESKHIDEKINAGLALLERKDPKSLKIITEILLLKPKDYLISPISSIGGGLKAWKKIPSVPSTSDEFLLHLELFTHLKEEILKKAFYLPEDTFFALLETIFEQEQNDIIPQAIYLLEQMESKRAIEFLKRNHQKIGAPLIRNWCNLALYRLGEEGKFGELLKEWLKHNQQKSLIQFRPLVPWQLKEKKESYELAPEETSRLLIEAFEAFARVQDEKGIEILLQALQNGNEKNRYVLAGLLLRTIQ